MVSMNQLAIVFGMLVVYFVNYIIEGLGDESWNTTTGWRWMFGSEAIPALALLLLMFTVPESPRWLCKQGKSELARSVLTRIGGDSHAKTEMAEIADALTHVGQITLLRRMAGAPVRGENYFKADITAGRVGPGQATPRREFE